MCHVAFELKTPKLKMGFDVFCGYIGDRRNCVYADVRPKVKKAQVMIRWLLICFVSISVIACSKPEVKYEYYDDGSTRSIIEVVNGLPNGKVSYYYRNGIIEQEGQFEENKRVGKFNFYDEFGRIEETHLYDNDGNLEDLIYYDSLGNQAKKLELSQPFSNIKNTIIEYGNNYEIEIGIGNRVTDSITVVIGELNNKKDSLMLLGGDTLSHDDYKFRYSIKPQTVGPHFFYYKVIQVLERDSTVEVRKMLIKQDFEVVPNIHD
ncbi:MAG: hypothetical protein AAF992_05260 [Bacteroidota bacterium]